ncbi:RidA family protein [Flexivirga alba]|uniref:RidA family protein n=1 Tax=Flexivirga alba TaxID=702742 RepID=A0ABW2ACN3_9MICO
MTSVVQLVRSDRLAPAPYAYAATSPAESRVIHLAGACPLNSDGTTGAIDDVAGQARICLANMEIALEAAGARLTDVISTRVLVATQDRAELVAAWDVVAAHFGAHLVPSTLVGVAVLGYPDQLVEIEAVAAVPG